MYDEDREYWQLRAHQELQQARGAASPAAGRAHYAMCMLYLGRLYPQGGGSILPAGNLPFRPIGRQGLRLASVNPQPHSPGRGYAPPAMHLVHAAG